MMQFSLRSSRWDRRHEFRRYDHDQLGIILGLLLRLEQFSKDWNVRQKWNLLESVEQRVIQQPADHETLPVLQFNFSIHLANRKAGDRKSGNLDFIAVVQRAHF